MMSNQLDNFIEGCRIIQNTQTPKDVFPLQAGKNVIYVFGDPSAMTPEGIEKLKELGFREHPSGGMPAFLFYT